MEISASQVKFLREKTGAGMMDCKKALVAAAGDMSAAEKWLQEQALVTADKKSSRIAAEGVIAKAMSDDLKHAVLVEVNSETDFVARGDEFVSFSNAVAQRALTTQVQDIETLASSAFNQTDATTIAQKAHELITKIGENIVVRRCVSMETNDVLGLYVHNNGRIGVIVDMKTADSQLAKNMAMHIAASNPLVISQDVLPAATIEAQQQLVRTQLQQSGKSTDVIEQLLQDEMQQYIDQVCLNNQMYIMDPSQTVGQFLTANKATITRFVRLELGEGIEKNQTDFVAEVMAQVRKEH